MISLLCHSSCRMSSIMSSLGNTVERGGSILVHCGGIVGSWRMGIEFSSVEEHSVWVL